MITQRNNTPTAARLMCEDSDPKSKPRPEASSPNQPQPGTRDPEESLAQPSPMRDRSSSRPAADSPRQIAQPEIGPPVVDPLAEKLLAEEQAQTTRSTILGSVPKHLKRTKSMNDQSHTTELKKAIQEFEAKVDVPVSIEDSDRRDQWKSVVNKSFDRMRELVDRQRQETHSKVFAQIAAQDASERDEIAQMRQSDARIAELMDVVKAYLASFALGATDDGRGPDIEDQVLDLRNVSHELAACVLAQEEAVVDWFAENFEPDA